jgi:transcriptional regulator GlxA family with amidase domain
MVVFPGFQLLDIGGIDVFTAANRFTPRPTYSVSLVSREGGLVQAEGGPQVMTQSVAKISARPIDTLLMAGAQVQGMKAAVQDAALAAWVQKRAPRLRRLGSVCAGSFALAAWGLLNDKRATTHWSATDLLRRAFPALKVEPEALYVQDGALWTSGGVTSGIDMCLAMLEQDEGPAVANQVAKLLILSRRRLGNQSQYSDVLRVQAGRYGGLLEWLRAHLREPINVAQMSARMGETERSFFRHFTAYVGVTPAAFLTQLRVEAGREMLDQRTSVKEAARHAGFSSEDQFARAFKRGMAMSPSQYKAMHASV